MVTLLVSHKLAGPLFRFQKELDLIGKGDFTQTVRLREKDQIAPMVDSLNQMRTNLQDKVLSIKKEVEKIIESTSGKDVSVELVEQLNRLHQKIESNFKV